MKSLPQYSFGNPVESFCFFDDLAKFVFPDSGSCVGRKRVLSVAEVAAITLIKSCYGITQLKQLYRLLSDRFSSEFSLPCYKNFVATMNAYTPQLLLLIQLLLATRNKNKGMINLDDSTPVPVCKNI